MDPTLIYQIIGFVCVVGGIFAISQLFGEKSDRASERLDEMRDPTLRNNSKEHGGVSGMLEKAAPKLSKALEPQSELEKNNLKVKLANAGYTSATAPQMFLTIKMAAAVLGLFVGGAYGVYSNGFDLNAMMWPVFIGGLFFYLPGFILGMQVSGRKSRIFYTLPDALDLLVVCTEAGLGLDAAMNRVADELMDAAPDICNEFKMCNQQLNLGSSRRDVLRDFSIRTGVTDVKALANVLIQAEKFGSSIAGVLRQRSDEMRERRKQMAEEKAQQTSVKLIFPLVLFIFPGIFVVLVGPAAIMMMNELFQ